MSTTLSGTVRAHGNAASNATVELHNETGDVVTQTQVDTQGRYTFYVTGGNWSVRAWDGHGHTGNGSSSLRDGEHASLDLDLEEPEGGH